MTVNSFSHASTLTLVFMLPRTASSRNATINRVMHNQHGACFGVPVAYNMLQQSRRVVYNMLGLTCQLDTFEVVIISEARLLHVSL